MTWYDPAYAPLLRYRSKKGANPRNVRRVRALRAGGMSYTEIVDQTQISRGKVIHYCSGRYTGPEYNTVSETDTPPQVNIGLTII